MALPAFTNANVNAYLASISNNAASLQQFVNDMKSNVVTAVTSRWALSSWQTDRLNFLAQYTSEITALLGTAQNILNNAYDYTQFPLQAFVTGVHDNPGGTQSDYAAGPTTFGHSEHPIDPSNPQGPKEQDAGGSTPF